MITQKYTSAATSVNSTKLPKIYNLLNWEELRNASSKVYPIVLDYGAGRYTDHIRAFCNKKGFLYRAYDPYNGIDANWQDEKPDVVICSNVLNVINEDLIMRGVHYWVAGRDCPYFITVYEGDKSGSGRVTKTDCYQRNCKTEQYRFIDEIIHKSVLTRRDYWKFIK